jgi:hypothetical protein
MTVPHVSTALRPGDYLQIASERMAVDGVPDGEGFARIERVEIITDIGFLAPGSTHVRTRATRQIAVVLCHGMPGPVMLREGDQWTLGEIDSGRARWDSAYPWWPETPEPLFTGSRLAAGPHPFRSNLHCRCQQPWANRRKRRAENRGIRSHGETIPMDHHPPPPGIDMNKAQLVEVIADQLGGRQQAADAVDHVLDAIVRAVVAGE